MPGDIVQYRISVQNPDRTRNSGVVTIMDQLPPSLRLRQNSIKYQGISTPAIVAPDGSSFSVAVPALAPGATGLLTYLAEVRQDARPGNALNIASAADNRGARSDTVAPMGMQRDGERVEVQGRHVVAVDDGNAYLAAGVAGMGVLWLPQYMANDHAARGELVPLFDGWRVDAMPMYVAFPPNRHVSAKLRAFIDWVVELMAVHAPLAPRPGKPTA